jgi:ribosome maturation factor RimP
MDLTHDLRTVVAPFDVELYDVEMASGTLNVVVTRPGGIDLDSLTAVTRAISDWLDAHDPIAGRYTLDVSSPGLERRLRTPAHFASARGEIVTLRERREGQPTRRLEGVVLSTDDQSVTLEDADAGVVTVAFDAVERARTVFKWGSEAKPSPSRGKNVTTSKKG